jgi:hypothetical protein
MYGPERCAAATLSPPPTSDRTSGGSSGSSISGSSSGSSEGSAGSSDAVPSVARAALMLEWWADVNMQAYKWAKAQMKPSPPSSSSSSSSSSHPPRYLLLRVEDLAVNANNATEATTLARLLQFAGVTRANYASGNWASDVLVASSAVSSSSAAGSASVSPPPPTSAAPSAALCAAVQHHGLGAYPFGGNKFSAEEKKRFLDAVGTSGQAALRHFGYDPNQWGLGAKRSHAADLDSTVLGDFHNHPDAQWYVDLVANALRACDSSSSSSSSGYGHSGGSSSSSSSSSVSYRRANARAAKREASIARLKAAAAKLQARGSDQQAANSASSSVSAYAASKASAADAHRNDGVPGFTESSVEAAAAAALPAAADVNIGGIDLGSADTGAAAAAAAAASEIQSALEAHPLHGKPGFESFAQRFGVGYSTHPKEHAHAAIDAAAAAAVEEEAFPGSAPSHGASEVSSPLSQDAGASPSHVNSHGAGAAAGASFADRFGLQGGNVHTEHTPHRHNHQQHQHHPAVPAAGAVATGAGTDDFFGVSSAVAVAGAVANQILPHRQGANSASSAVTVAAGGEAEDATKAKLRAAAVELTAQFTPAQVH